MSRILTEAFDEWRAQTAGSRGRGRPLMSVQIVEAIDQADERDGGA